MSTRTDTVTRSDSTSDTPALGSRENWWGDDHEADTDSAGHTELTGTSYYEYVAGSYLRQFPDTVLLCPECHARGREGVLSDPLTHARESKVVIPEAEEAADGQYHCEFAGCDHQEPTRHDLACHYATAHAEAEVWREWRYQARRRHRYCQRCGYVSWGGILQDRPVGRFLEIVDEALDHIQGTDAAVPPRTREQVFRNAQSRKQQGKSDERIMEMLMLEIEHADPDLFED